MRVVLCGYSACGWFSVGIRHEGGSLWVLRHEGGSLWVLRHEGGSLWVLRLRPSNRTVDTCTETGVKCPLFLIYKIDLQNLSHSDSY